MQEFYKLRLITNILDYKNIWGLSLNSAFECGC